MRPSCPSTGYASELDNLELCLACLYQNREILDTQFPRHLLEFGMESFQVVSASAVMSELDYLESKERPGWLL